MAMTKKAAGPRVGDVQIIRREVVATLVDDPDGESTIIVAMGEAAVYLADHDGEAVNLFWSIDGVAYAVASSPTGGAVPTDDAGEPMA